MSQLVPYKSHEYSSYRPHICDASVDLYSTNSPSDEYLSMLSDWYYFGGYKLDLKMEYEPIIDWSSYLGIKLSICYLVNQHQ